VDVVDAVAAPERVTGVDLVIDAAYGTGFRGEFAAPDCGSIPVLAVDIPSGVDGTTGEQRGRALAATRTVTFAAMKPGLVLEPGRSLAGEVVVADIGLDVGQRKIGVVERTDVAAWIPPREPTAHKWQASVLVVAGSAGMTGAGHLAAAAAQRVGAGMVRLASPGLGDDPGRPTEAVGLALPAAGWDDVVVGQAPRFQALVIGPGLGTDDATVVAVRHVLAQTQVPTVVDGDALTALGTDAPAVVSARRAPTVLTPHDGELARLTGAPVGPERLDIARRLAADTGAVVLLKGPSTVIADPAGSVRIVTSGDPRLATAGTGDVLSGTIGALLARGVGALEAAAAGAWLHARAGVLGPIAGLVAGDLVELLPLALVEVSA
jgi:NAD(P)H-hydrate epimerase